MLPKSGIFKIKGGIKMKRKAVGAMLTMGCFVKWYSSICRKQ